MHLFKKIFINKLKNNYNMNGNLQVYIFLFNINIKVIYTQELHKIRHLERVVRLIENKTKSYKEL